MELTEDDAARLIEDGKLSKAERAFRLMLEKDPHCVGAHFHLARIYRRTGKYKLALYHGRLTLRLHPKEKNARLNVGLIYELMGRADMAAKYYKNELLPHPDSPETLFNIGRLYFDKHAWKKAGKYLRRCFDVGYEHEYEDTVNKLAICYYKLRDDSSYIDVLSRSLVSGYKSLNTNWLSISLSGFCEA